MFTVLIKRFRQKHAPSMHRKHDSIKNRYAGLQGQLTTWPVNNKCLKSTIEMPQKGRKFVQS